MGLADVKPFFRTRMEGLGYEEHNQVFEPGEIAASIVDGSFHLETGDIISAAANQRSHTFDYPMTIRVYKIGYSDILEATDAALEDADVIIADLLNPDVRFNNGVGIKDIVPNSARLELCF